MPSPQRAMFDIPGEVTYLNAASYTPLPLTTQEAGRAAVGRKGAPWTLDLGFPGREYERCRAAAARLIDVDASDVALIPSVSYGIATAAKIIPVAAGSRVLVLENDHASPVLEWHVRAGEGGFGVETVPQPRHGDWTSAILEAIARQGAAPIALASISTVHWSDGCVIDVGAVSAALRGHGAGLVLDATQGVGVIALDIAAIDPDVLVFPTYKWLLGPYGRAFMYVAKRRQHGIPLEQTASGRKRVRAEDPAYFTDLAYQPDARRYDMGERDHFITLDMAAVSIEIVEALKPAAIAAHARALTDRAAEALQAAGLGVPDRRFRAPHLLCVDLGGVPAGDVAARLAAENIHVASRLGQLRMSPHVYNDAADINRFTAAMKRVLRGG